MPRRDHARQVREDLRYIGLLVNSGLLERGAALIRRDEESTGPDGYPSSTGGSATSTIASHSIGSTTESAALRLAQQDPVTKRYRGTDDDPIHRYATTFVRSVHEALGRMLDATNALKAAEQIEDDNRGRQSGLGECVNCGRIVTGIGDDRLRASRDERCYRYWLRTGEDRKVSDDE